MKRLSTLALIAALMLVHLQQARSEPVQQATGPQQVEPGNLLVLQVGGPQRWIIMPHNGEEYQLYVVTATGDAVNVTVHKLPIGGEPDDPDDPPPSSLATLVRDWAAEVGDENGQTRLAASYQVMLQLVDRGAITTPAQLVKLQELSRGTTLGPSLDKWKPFFDKLDGYVAQNEPPDLAGYRAMWMQIAEGLASEVEAQAVEVLKRMYLRDLADTAEGQQ